MISPQPTEHSTLVRAAEIMNTLRSPGGCAWDAAQTHQSLTRYLLEEAYEVLEAIESGPDVDYALLREELGDLLLQVLFHARIASERPADQGGFTIDDVAGDLVDKLVRRHPHVFEESSDADVATLNETWEKQKIAEKGRTSAVDGVPLGQPSLALAAKLVSRAKRAGLAVDLPRKREVPPAESSAVGFPREREVPPVETPVVPPADIPVETTEAAIGAKIFAVVQEAVAAGVDPEGALRRTTLAYRDAIQRAES
jgi:XTP/dITP diphosphohydrolase